jgi:hypothetical protein
MERASVVSTWRTTSFSKSSCVRKPLAANFFQASRWGSGMEAVENYAISKGSVLGYTTNELKQLKEIRGY